MNAVEEKNRVLELERRVLFNESLRSITNNINSARNVTEILVQLKDGILSLFDADRITIYAVDPVRKELFSKYMVSRELREIRVPISPASIAGYVAYSMKTLNIADVYDSKALKAIDINLHFDGSWDIKANYRTKQVLATPIVFERHLLGVIQLINRKKGDSFTDSDEKNLVEMARILGIAFRNQAKMVHTRYDYLLSQNLITEAELRKVVIDAREQKKEIESILMNEYKIKKSDIGISLGNFFKCRFVEFSNNVILQKELLKGLNTAYLKKSYWCPLSHRDGKVTIAIDNPKDPKTLEIKGLIRAKEYEFRIALKSDIIKFIERAEKDSRETGGSMNEILAEMGVKEEKETEAVDSAIDENAGVIVRLVNQIIIDGYEKGASDIHIEPSKGRKTTLIRFRIDGACMKHLEIPFSHSRALASRIKIMANLDIAEKRLPQDGKIKFIYKDRPIELRVATLPTTGGEDVVMRILAASEPMPLDALNLSDRNFRILKEVISKPYGIVLVVGPTGSGKTTTLHSAIGSINTSDKKIWTAEDPVEITQEGLRQVEVKPKIDFNFARAMRSFLRADPDIIMVGEMRDHETAAIGIEASLTGHLVFSTLHTNSAPETITRLIDMGIDPFNFADALLGILAQRLVRTFCRKCREPYNPSEEEFQSIRDAYGDGFSDLGVEYDNRLVLYKARGCGECNNTGYKGRTGIHELLAGTKDIKPLIAKKSPVEIIRAQAILDGMRALYQDGIAKVLKGFTDMKQVRSVCIQ